MDKMEMARRQEEEWAKIIGGHRTRGSGSQWTEQMDARANHLTDEFAFAVECKSTGGQSIAVSREMIHKAIEQAGSERPAIALRIYENDRYDVLYDWVALRKEDFAGMLELITNPPYLILANPDKYGMSDEEIESVRAALDEALRSGHSFRSMSVSSPEVIELRAERAELQRQVHELQQQLAVVQLPPLTPDHARMIELEGRPTIEQHNEVLGQYARAQAAATENAEKLTSLQDFVKAAVAESPLALATQLGAAQNTIRFLQQTVGQLHAQAQEGSGRRNELERTMAEPPPRDNEGNLVLPWTVIFKETGPDGIVRHRGLHYDATGAMKPLEHVGQVTIHNTIGQQREIFVDNVRIGNGAFYSEGHLVTSVVPLLAPKNAPPIDPLDQN